MVIPTGLLIYSLQRDERNPEYEIVSEYCLDLVQKIEGVELNANQAKFVPIGAKAKGLSYSGLMMVLEEETSGISVKCSVVSYGSRIKFFAINGEDKTDLVRREERKE